MSTTASATYHVEVRGRWFGILRAQWTPAIIKKGMTLAESSTFGTYEEACKWKKIYADIFAGCTKYVKRDELPEFRIVEKRS